MVKVKHELTGAPAVKTEVTEAVGNGGQQLHSADHKSYRGLGDAGGGSVAGAVNVKREVIEGNISTKGGAAGEEPSWKWIAPAEVEKQLHGVGES